MTLSEIIPIVGVGGMGVVLTAIVQGVFNRRKLGADATGAIQQAAKGVVDMVTEQNRELRAQVAESHAKIRTLEDRVDHLEYEQAQTRAVNQMHAAWDFLAYEELQAAGSSLPHPPPLYPPPRSRASSRSAE